MHTNGSNLNRQVFFVDNRTKFHVARCCVTQKNAILILNILMTMTIIMMIKQILSYSGQNDWIVNNFRLSFLR